VPESDKILSQHEVDALLSAIDSGAGELPSEATAVPYDFRRPVRLSGEQVRALEALHELYARSLQAALAALLRTPVEVKVAGVHQVILRDFVQSLPRPTVFSVVSWNGEEGAFLFEINPSVAWPMIERLLGSARVGAAPPDRPLSALEWNVVGTALGRALDLLREAWAPTGPGEFRVLRRESDPALAALPNADEPAVAVVLEVALGDRRGCVDVGYPFVAIQGRLERLAGGAKPGPPAGAAAPEGPGEGLAGAGLRVEASLPTASMRLRDLRDLRPGDVLATRHPQGAPVVVSVEGRPKFPGRLGRLRDRRAVRVEAGPEGFRGAEGAAPEPLAVLRGAAAEPPAGAPAAAAPGVLGHLLRLPLTASAVLAERRMRLRDVLALRPGAVLEFGRPADAPAELRVAGRPVAEGQPVRIGERFGLRIASARDPRARVRALGP
jgi:flagellar motor switch protein FliM